MRLVVTTTRTTSDAPSSPRISPHSTIAPNTGAITTTTSSRAGQVLIPHSTWSCQKVSAASMLNAPWAKLKMPEMVYVTTSPVAEMA
jgi:hypothetical protein